jgi:peptidylprolyl isomerase
MKYVAISVIIFALAALSLSMFAVAQTAPAKKNPAAPANAAPTRVTGEGVKTDSGLRYWEIRIGHGEPVKEGSHVRVHYTGWLATGKKFDSSLDVNQPLDFTIGNGEVIKGWEEGVTGMKVGGKRQLRIPPALAYGADGTPDGTIPPNATLIFDVQLLAVQ